MQRGSFEDVALYLERASTAVAVAPSIAARLTAPLIQVSIREQFGHAPPLADLAEATQIDRAEHGYAANEPLVRTHELEDSYEAAVVEGPAGPIAGAGSANRLALFHEHGYMNARTGRLVPARPVGWLGFMAVQPMARTIWKNVIGRAIGKRN